MNIPMISRILAGAALLASAATSAQSVGDRVLGRWPADGLWYPARVQSVAGNAVELAFDDGDLTKVSRADVRLIDWAVSTRVQCNFRNQGKYFPARIARIDGEAIDIAYDDGDRETATISRCRSN